MFESKMLIAELGKRMEKYDLINNLALVQAGITLGSFSVGILILLKMNCREYYPAR